MTINARRKASTIATNAASAKLEVVRRAITAMSASVAISYPYTRVTSVSKAD